MKTNNAQNNKGVGVNSIKIILISAIILAVSFLVFVLVNRISFSKNRKKISAEAAFTITSSLTDDQYNNNTNFEIGTPQGLSTFFNMVYTRHDFSSKHVSLTSNIDFNSNAVYPSDAELDSSVFNGTFDGRNYKISNIKTSCGKSERREPKKAWYYYYYAIFPSLGANSSIINLKIQNIIGGTDKNNSSGGTHSSLYYRYYYKGGINYTADSSAQIINCIVDGADGNVTYPFSNSAKVSNCLIISANNANFGTTNESCVTYTSSNTYTTTSSLDNQFWLLPDSGNTWNGGRPMLKSFIMTWKDITIKIDDENKTIGALTINGYQQGSGQGIIKIPSDYIINTTFSNASQSLSIVGNTIIAAPSIDNADFVRWTKEGDVITAHFKLKPVAVTINVVDGNGNAFANVTYSLTSTLNGATYTSTNGKYDIGVDITLTNITVTDNRYYLVGVYHDEISSGNKIQENNGSYTHNVSNQTTIIIQVKLKSYGLELN